MSFHYRWFSHDEELTDALGNRRSRAALERPARPRTAYTRGEVLSMVLSVLVLFYGLAVFVVPFVMFGVAFLLYEMHRLLPLALGPAGVPLARGVRAFSLVTLFGAVLLLFF